MIISISLVPFNHLISGYNVNVFIREYRLKCVLFIEYQQMALNRETSEWMNEWKNEPINTYCITNALHSSFHLHSFQPEESIHAGVSNEWIKNHSQMNRKIDQKYEAIKKVLITQSSPFHVEHGTVIYSTSRFFLEYFFFNDKNWLVDNGKKKKQEVRLWMDNLREPPEVHYTIKKRNLSFLISLPDATDHWFYLRKGKCFITCDNYDEWCNNIEKKLSAEFASMKLKRRFPVLENCQNQHEKTNSVAGWIQCRKKYLILLHVQHCRNISRKFQTREWKWRKIMCNKMCNIRNKFHKISRNRKSVRSWNKRKTFAHYFISNTVITDQQTMRCMKR